MNVLFSADWHIKLGQKNVPKDWQIDRYRSMFKQLNERAAKEDIDLVILGGDIFDRLPTLEELELFFEYVSSVTTNTIIYDGNHEATKKGKTFLHNLKRVTERLNSNISILTSSTSINGIDFIPYTDLHKFKPEDFSNQVMCTHVRGEVPPHVKPEIDLDKLNRWDVVLAGDLHSYANCQRNILYPGSPVTTGFHRKLVDTGYIVFDTETLEHTWEKLEVPQLIRKTVESAEDIQPTDYHHTIYELVGNVKSLSKIDANSNELIDKKVVNHKTDKSLDLKDKTIAEELSLYLTSVVDIPKEEVEELMEVFSDYSAKIEMG